MTRRPRRRTSGFRVALLVIMIGGALYVNQVVVPATPPLFVPTATPTQSPESYVSNAEELYKAGKLTQAIDSYKEAILNDPANPANYVALARLQVFAGDYEEAIENAQNALLKNSSNPMAHAIQGWALGFLEKHSEAEIELQKALDLDPNSALAHAYYAEILIAQSAEDFALAEKASMESKLAVELDNTLMETHRIRGIVLYYTQNHDEAIQEFQSAIAINKSIYDLHLYLGLTYKAQEKYDLAEEALLAAVALNPTDANALTELSRAYFAAGRYAQAAQYAEEAVKIDPSNPRLHGALGYMYYKGEEYNRAIPELELAIRGGTTEDGVAVEGLPLEYDDRIISYYSSYGFALARANRCGEAAPIFQALLTGTADNEIAVYNGTEGMNFCAGGGEETEESVTDEGTSDESASDGAVMEEGTEEPDAVTTREP